MSRQRFRYANDNCSYHTKKVFEYTPNCRINEKKTLKHPFCECSLGRISFHIFVPMEYIT